MTIARFRKPQTVITVASQEVVARGDLVKQARERIFEQIERQLVFVRERHQSLELRKVLQSAVKAPQVWGRGIPRAAEAELMVSRFTHPPDPNQPSSQRSGRTWLRNPLFHEYLRYTPKNSFNIFLA